MRGLELNSNLLSAEATFVKEANTAPTYRLWSINDRYPAMMRVASGGDAIALEVWAIPAANLSTIRTNMRIIQHSMAAIQDHTRGSCLSFGERIDKVLLGLPGLSDRLFECLYIQSVLHNAMANHKGTCGSGGITENENLAVDQTGRYCFPLPNVGGLLALDPVSLLR